ETHTKILSRMAVVENSQRLLFRCPLEDHIRSLTLQVRTRGSSSDLLIMLLRSIATINEKRLVRLRRNRIESGVHLRATNRYTRCVLGSAWNPVFVNWAQSERIGRVGRIARRVPVQVEPAADARRVFLRKLTPSAVRF